MIGRLILVLGLMALGGCEVPASNPSGPVAAPAAPAVAAGQGLPFGEIGTFCDDPEPGTAIATEAGYTLRDSAPGSTAPRTHWVTGFSDGCARQFTAALALFGDAATHETTVSAAGGGDATDRAYEAVKAEVCGVAAGQPCPDIARLAADTVFVSMFPAFGGESAEILLHGGEVLASDV
jgi:hypothetical protein